MLSSAVSSRMIAALAKAEGFHWEETLTGFKWLCSRATELRASGMEVMPNYTLCCSPCYCCSSVCACACSRCCCCCSAAAAAALAFAIIAIAFTVAFAITVSISSS